MSKEVKLPELGENVESAQVLNVLVAPGDTVVKDQSIIELETDKATAEVPSDAAGVVKEVSVKAGDVIKVGQTILVLEGGAASAPSPAETEEPEADEAEPPVAEKPTPAEERRTRVAPPPVAVASRPAPAPEPDDEPAAPARATATPAPAPRPTASPSATTQTTAPRASAPATSAPASAAPERAEAAPAAPSVRRLARELGIDINVVPGTGPGGRISEDDVKQYTRDLVSGRARPASAPSAAPSPAGPGAPALPDFSVYGEVEREPVSKIRRLTGEAMSLSWSVIPHVTQFDRADITELEAWRQRYARKTEAAGGKLTVTAIAVKVAASAMKVFPYFNCSFDDREQEIVLKKYVNIGVAVDTDRGLLVPVIRDADTKNINQIAAELGDLAGRARDRKITSDELAGANLNISNLGGLGTTYFSPIVAWPQVAVIGMGRASMEAVYTDDGFEPRLMLPLAVSYDHRVIDGANAARFLRWVAEALEQPLLLALEG